MWLIILAAVLHCTNTYDVDLKKLEGLSKARVEVEDIEEIKAFVIEDASLYHNLAMVHVPDADPELVLLNHNSEELQRIDMSEMTHAEINEVLGQLGFYKKAHENDEVPEEFRNAPAKDGSFEHSFDTENPSVQPEAEVKHTDL